jgi:hypothetical protein
MKGALLVVIPGIVLAGCATPPPQMSTRFDPETASVCDGTGSAVITGQAFLRTRGGDVRYASGEAVVLMPAMPYTRELVQMQILYGSGPKTRDSRLFSHTRIAQADAEGEFEFSGLPACTYIVRSQVYWDVPTGYTSQRQGGVVAKEVTVTEGQAVKAILTR